jgi:hypothetical protein
MPCLQNNYDRAGKVAQRRLTINEKGSLNKPVPVVLYVAQIEPWVLLPDSKTAGDEPREVHVHIASRIAQNQVIWVDDLGKMHYARGFSCLLFSTPPLLDQPCFGRSLPVSPEGETRFFNS